LKGSIQLHARRTISGVIAVVVVAGIGLASAGTASADTIERANQIAADVQAITGTFGVVPESEMGHDADSAATARVGGGTVDVPKDPSSGVAVTTPSGEHVEIGIPNADGARDAQTAPSGTTVYADPASGTATAVQAMTNGVRELFTLNDSSASPDLTMPLELPEGASLIDNGAGGYDIVGPARSGLAMTIASIEAPWAKDAVGKSLPTHYSLNGEQLTQHVDTTGATFPVVADPHYTWGWVTGTVYYGRAETRQMKTLSTATALLGGLCAATGPETAGASCAIGAALYAQWAYVATNAYGDGACIEIKVPYLWASKYSGGYCR
jgi:hypothetical protein